MQQPRIAPQPQGMGQMSSGIHLQQQQQPQHLENKMVPIQIKLPQQPGANSQPLVLTVQIPGAALQANQLQQVLTGPVIATLMGLPQNIACNVLQQHINAAFNQQPLNIPKMMQGDAHYDSTDDESDNASVPKHVMEVSMKRVKSKAKKDKVLKMLHASDGQSDDSTDDNSDESVEEEAEDSAEDEEDNTAEQVDAEPLNSGDDESEESDAAPMDTDDIIVCQFDKVARKRNKWKFYLRHGIMNLNGLDYIFERLNGEAEW